MFEGERRFKKRVGGSRKESNHVNDRIFIFSDQASLVNLELGYPAQLSEIAILEVEWIQEYSVRVDLFVLGIIPIELSKNKFAVHVDLVETVKSVKLEREMK